MTVGSLGLRSSSSYGSLQQHQQQLQVHSSSICPPPINSTPINSNRKNPKMQLLGSREKERRLSWICKFASSRKVGMFLLIVTSVAVIFSFFSALSKDVDQVSGPETVVGYSDEVWKIVSHGMTSSNYLSPPSAFVTEDKENTTSVFNIQHTNVDNETQIPVPFVYSTTIPPQHPCENFSLPPSPVDPKHTGPRPCDVCYVPVDLAMAYMPVLPSASPVIKNLDYVLEENLLVNEANGGSIFGGHPSLQQRGQSFDIKESMTVHCGFVKGRKPGQGTGFDIDEADLLEMEHCQGVVVASAIFGNYDIMQQPRNISEASRRTACFYMFVDQETEASIRNYTTLDSTRKVGLWRVVVVQNLPYADARRNGKGELMCFISGSNGRACILYVSESTTLEHSRNEIPKLLLQRLFPNARFSLWIDGKLKLVVDPYQILERFLWQHNASFAISRHYRRFDVFEEAEANKAAGKYDNSSIDSQIEFYKREGLTHFSPAKYPITSDVPEGCVIIREHTPITNLFTCLWFNEVDRFTSRDQLSFSTVRDKIMSKVNWSINMFMDCERRNFVVQAYHRDILEQRLAALNHHPQPSSIKDSIKEPVKELPKRSTSDVIQDVSTTKSTPSRKQSKRGRERKSGSRKRRPRGAANIRDPNSF